MIIAGSIDNCRFLWSCRLSPGRQLHSTQHAEQCPSRTPPSAGKARAEGSSPGGVDQFMGTEGTERWKCEFRSNSGHNIRPAPPCPLPPRKLPGQAQHRKGRQAALQTPCRQLPIESALQPDPCARCLVRRLTTSRVASVGHRTD